MLLFLDARILPRFHLCFSCSWPLFLLRAFRPVWPGRCDLSFICIPQSTRALDQGGVEPRQAVSPKAPRPWTIPLRYSVGFSCSWPLGPLSVYCMAASRAQLFFSCVCLMASMARSVNCLGRKKAVQVHLIGAKPIVQVKR